MKPAWTTDLFPPTLSAVTSAFRSLETRVPPPIRVSWKDSFVFRYSERTIQQAIVQKLARVVTGLRAIDVLLDSGLFQEQGIVQRAVDEIGEDITFLSFAVIYSELTQRHQDYLDYFYAEEFDDPNDIMGSHKSRGMISREKIRAYINQKLGADSSRANVAGKIITKAYSGFVHGASPHIMDMCGGTPPRFDVSGKFQNLRGEVHADDALNYFFRALLTTAVASKALGDESLFQEMRALAADFEAKMSARDAG